MTATPRAQVEFLGLDFDSLTETQVADWLAGRTGESPFAYVVTPNVDHMVRLNEDPAAPRDAYEAADLCLCDSRVLARLAGFCGVALPVVPGSDLTATLFASILGPGDRVLAIGGTVADIAALRALHPSIDIRHHDAPMGLRRDAAARAACVAAAAEARARIVLLAVGSPQQEMLALEMKRAGTVGGTALCIGASIDFLTGAQTRAPRVVQKAGMEWAWRLGTQPGRLWRRYLVDGPAIFPAVWRWRKARR